MRDDHVPIDPDDSCPFCMGSSAAIDGLTLDDNPFDLAEDLRGSIDWYETDYGLWETGWRVEGRPSRVVEGSAHAPESWE